MSDMENAHPTATAPDAGAQATVSTTSSIVFALVGSGGDGVVLLGELLMRMAAHRGLYGMMVQSYGPQIRGGESAVVLRLAQEETRYEGEQCDLLLCFRLADMARFRGSIQLASDAVVVVEASEPGELPDWVGRSSRPAVRYPFAKIEDGQEVPGEPKNMYALGVIMRSLGWQPELAHWALEQRFGSRPDALARNRAAFDCAYAADTGVGSLRHLSGHGVPLHVETGNEAIARGAMDAGLRFFAGYPITPSSEVMETLIEELPARGGRVVQAEDEIASMGMVIGASFGGVPAMTATSGPGISLMTEMMGLSSMAELPTIIVDCQRAGPATGMPSRTEQSDLYHSIYGGHGDFPRAVLGVFDVVHGREVMHKAMHLAERYQLPVMVLSDAYIAQRRQIVDSPIDPQDHPRRRFWSPADDPKRFSLNAEHGIGPFRRPGTPGGEYLASGISHTAEGAPTSDTSIHHAMNAKRFAKLGALAAETTDWYRTLGDPAARRGIIAWGSTIGVLEEWLETHPDHRVFLPEILHPFPLAALARWRQGLEWTAVLEMSFQGQLHRHLAGITDMTHVRSLARSGGVPLTPGEVDRMIHALPLVGGR
jgi:2-oxoglutarate ferredoxin oxidoreductase subunit alpha